MAEEEEEADLVEEAEGLKLHLNPRAATGYRGVQFCRDGRPKPFIARDCETHLGAFATAVEAAVRYARHVQQQQQQPEAMEAEAMEEEAAETEEEEAAAEEAVEEEAEEAEEAEALVQEAEGLQLHLSSRSSTGGQCTFEPPHLRPPSPLTCARLNPPNLNPNRNPNPNPNLNPNQATGASITSRRRKGLARLPFERSSRGRP